MNASESIRLKPNKPELYDGKRDFLVFNTWLYKVEQYFGTCPVIEPDYSAYASTSLAGTAAICWYTLVQSDRVPSTWKEFKNGVIAECIPEDHVRQARDCIRRLKQNGSVSKYLSEFCNLVLTILDISFPRWEMGQVFAGLKYDIRIKVMKSTVVTFEVAATVTLRVSIALWSFTRDSGVFKGERSGVGQSPMNIGNLEKQKWDAKWQGDVRNNACFKCDKVGCRR